jgi:hypothetical protein
LIIPFFLFLLSGEAKGDEFKLIPSLGLREQYTDNLFFTDRDKKGDFITTISTGLALSKRTERLNANLLGRFSWLGYARNSELSGAEQDVRGSLGYSVTPRLKFSVEAKYKSDIRPDRDIEVSGLVMSHVRRHWQNFAGRAEYVFSEKTKSIFSYSYERSDFKDPDFVDVQAHDANLGLIHDLSQHVWNTAGRMNVGYSWYRYQDTTVHYYFGTIGMSRALNEKWNILLDAGASYTQSEFEANSPASLPAGGKQTQNGTGWFGQATISYRGEKTEKGERTTGDLAFNHRLTPASGTVGVTERTSLTLGVVHRFTCELSGRLSTVYYFNRAERGRFSTAGIDETTFRLNPAIRYEFTRDIALEASYSYDWVKNQAADTSAKRNLLMINFIIQYPFVK